MEMLNIFTTNLALLITVISTIAFLVSIITEVTKNIGALSKIPTDLQVIVLSMVLCLVSYLAYTSYYVIAIHWYYIFVSIIISFIVSFIAMYGWDKFMTLYARFKK